MLADLCFSDLVLYVPAGDSSFEIINHIRPSTSQTIYHSDLVGEIRSNDQRPLVSQAYLSGEMTHGDIDSAWLGETIRVSAIPVRCDGQVIAVMSREFVSAARVRPGALEQTYLQVFDRFTQMIAAGTFPFPEELVRLTNTPRVGDGVILLSADGRVEYASPNATSALTRFGARGVLIGQPLAALGADSHVLAQAFAQGAPGVGELESETEVTISARLLPLLDSTGTTGAIVLLRDISDLRRRDRLLMSKDATIREIHHRVKNNLQTISSILRLQGRRLSEPTAKAAIEESVRRIRSIALVHETLSRDAGDDVRFSTLLRPLVRMVEESLVAPDRPVRFTVEGDGGVVPSALATSLSVVLTELLQNAVEHAFTAVAHRDAPQIVIRLERVSEQLRISVSDNGVGFPAEFHQRSQQSLGISIVSALVETELLGTIEFSEPLAPERSAPAAGAEITICVPVNRQSDTAELGTDR